MTTREIIHRLVWTFVQAAAGTVAAATVLSADLVDAAATAGAIAAAGALTAIARVKAGDGNQG